MPVRYGGGCVLIVSDERVARFVSNVLGHALCPPYSVIGTDIDGEIVNGVLFNCFEGANVHVSAAGGRWGRDIIRAVGRYVYGQLGCERMTITTEHERVARYAERLGGQREGLLRSHFGPSRDAIIVGILKAEFRLT